MAERSDVAIMCMGLSPAMEGEEGAVADSDGGGDRFDINLPNVQTNLLKAIQATGTPVVLVLLNGSALPINWEQENIPAIVEAWYPGEEGGTALADILFGNFNPVGRLPVTFVKSGDDLPPFHNYEMEGRTYRFMTKEPLYPFGFGLSYTKFEYGPLKLAAEKIEAGDELEITVEVKNVGERDGDEIAQLYLTDLEASTRVAIRELRGIECPYLTSGESTELTFTLDARDMSLIDDEGRRVLEPGKFSVSIGGSQPDARSAALGSPTPSIATFEVVGDRLVMEY